MFLQKTQKKIIRKKTKNKHRHFHEKTKKRAVYRLSDFVFGSLRESFYAFVSCPGSFGVTHTVRLLVKITMPGLAPAGFLTYLTGT